MLKNVRRFFRYDMEMAFRILPEIDAPELDSRLKAAMLPSYRSLEKNNWHALQNLLSKIQDEGAKSFVIFDTLNKKVEFLEWLLKEFAQGRNPRIQPSFPQRYKQDRALTRPKLPESSHIAPLILAIYDTAHEMINALLQVIKGILLNRIFLFPVTAYQAFNDRKFISNLHALAEKGVMPAQILTKLVMHLNHQIDLMNLLIEVNQEVSDYQNWPQETLNLSASGLAFVTHSHYEKFSFVHCLLRLDSEVFAIRGKVLNQIELRMGHYKTVVDFELPTEADQTKIHNFIQYKEIDEAMRWQKGRQNA